jgi:hypothetical protein
MPSHTNIKKYTASFIDKRKNGHAIRTGTEINGKYLIAVDIDDKPNSATISNGLEKWKELLKTNYNIPERAAVDIDDKLIRLIDEITIQIKRIENEENIELLEVVKLFY